jgi:hypothetical protein
MAKQHTKEAPVHPDVAYEREDIAGDEVMLWGIGFAFVALAGTLFGFWLAWRMLQAPRPTHELDLPPAAVDKEKDAGLPPDLRLEALEDLREEKPRLFPSRAEEYLAPQFKELEGIDGAFKKMKFPERKKGAAAPTTLPSKASAGRRGGTS